MDHGLTAAEFARRSRQFSHMDRTDFPADRQRGHVQDHIRRQIVHRAVVPDVDRIEIQRRIGLQRQDHLAGIFRIIGMVRVDRERRLGIIFPQQTLGFQRMGFLLRQILIELPQRLQPPFLPFLRILEKRQIFHDVFVVADRIHPERFIDFFGISLFRDTRKDLVPVFGSAHFFDEFGHAAFAGVPLADVEQPVHVIDAGGDHLELARFHAEFFSDQAERAVYLMAEAQRLDLRKIILEIGAEDRHRIGKIHQPRIGTQFFHPEEDLAVETDVAHPVNDPAGTAVFRFDLKDAVFFGDLEIPRPIFIAFFLAGGDHIIGAVQRLIERGRGKQ